MLYFNYVLSFVSILSLIISIVYSYDRISLIKFKYRLLDIILIVVFVYVIFGLRSLSPLYRVILNLVAFFVLLESIYRENYGTTLVKVILLYLYLLLVDFVSSLLVILIPFINSDIMNNSMMIMSILTFIESGLFFLFFSLNRIINIIKKFVSYILSKDKVIIVIPLVFVFISFCLFAYFHSRNRNFESYLLILFVMGLFVMLSTLILVQYFKNKKQEEEQHSLLSLISDYELILENDRINRHEMLNNLVILRSYPDKSSKKYNDMIDKIINDYQNKKSSNMTSLYKLPSGIKGIVYYKISTINDKDVEFNTLITDEAHKSIEKLDERKYYLLCKIIGILLDNAIEAALLTKEKLLLIDIYLNNNDINIYIENSFKGDIDMDKIYKKGFSSKGSNRGFGLYIISKLVKKEDDLSFSQYVCNKHFVSILTIKK